MIAVNTNNGINFLLLIMKKPPELLNLLATQFNLLIHSSSIPIGDINSKDFDQPLTRQFRSAKQMRIWTNKGHKNSFGIKSLGWVAEQ